MRRVVTSRDPAGVDVPRGLSAELDNQAPEGPSSHGGLACRRVEASTSDGALSAFLVRPLASGPHPVVFLYIDAKHQEEGELLAKRVAAAGYYVLLPELGHHLVSDCSDGMRAVADARRPLCAEYHELVKRDTEALVRLVDGDQCAMATEIGAVGYCCGGACAILAAAHEPARIKAVASIDGYKLVTDQEDSPHRLVSQVAAEMYFAFAEQDEQFDRVQVGELVDALAGCSTPHRIERYPGTRTGFAFPECSESYDASGAQRQWERVLSLLKRRLPQPERLEVASALPER